MNKTIHNYIYILYICLLFFYACNPTNKTIFKEREFLTLSGTWKSSLGIINLPGTIDESKLSPYTQDTLNTAHLTRLHPFEGVITYTKEVTISDKQANKNWRLIMERTKPSTLYIDKDSIGSCSLLLSPQIYNIGKLSAGTHTITIKIDNGVHSVPSNIKGSHAWTDATQTNWNGIIGKFGLEAYDEVLIHSLRVIPSASKKKAQVIAKIQSNEEGRARIIITGHTWNTASKIILPEQNINIDLNLGENLYEFPIELGEDIALWSEFDPALYKLNVEINCNNKSDYLMINFGIRDFSTEGKQFTINSLKTFLRGKHDACVFPLTGYPPMKADQWIQQMKISKSFGFNHYRFHSWTPPQAAFDAANQLGIYLQPELPFWGEMKRENIELNDFLLREGEQLLENYGNNPSFVMMALGNELSGDFTLMRDFVENFRSIDNDKLYAFGSNNALGTAGVQLGEDFFVTCRVRGEVGSSDYSQHTRASFSFADAKSGGYLNGLYPSSDRVFDKPVSECPVPIISHENGQFQIYPDYKQIEKYVGVLYPYNLEVFERLLAKNGMQDQADKFHQASTQFAAICYKADLEMCFRTPEFGGYQLLDLQDYPGQGSAYVGLLDAFMDCKSGITPEIFKQHNAEIIPLSLMPKYCWSNDEVFSTQIKISNYSQNVLEKDSLKWTVRLTSNDQIIGEGTFDVYVKQGEISNVGNIVFPLNHIMEASKLTLSLKIREHTNNYDIWVYPRLLNTILKKDFVETSSLEKALETLKDGKKVLFTPKHETVHSLTVGGLFTPDYWNYGMFQRISKQLDREISPGTLSILTDPTHSLFKSFPTDQHSNWQWWVVLKNSRPFILDKSPKNYKPIIQTIDNVERNHKLGLIFEMQVETGKLLVCMTNIEAILNKPEGEQYYYSICNYINSDNFKPTTVFSTEEVKLLFEEPSEEKEITGVKNITSYK